MPRQLTFATSGQDLVGRTIHNGRLELLERLGAGAYGVVYLATDLAHPTPVFLAVKCLLRAGLDARGRHFLRREIALHELASRHRGVVTLHKVLEEGDYVFLIMDYFDGGDMFGHIVEKRTYLGNDELIRSVFIQIIDAVHYCHSFGIYHRDLKPENIVVKDQGQTVCIMDFGLATSEVSSTDFGCGSTFYLSPEGQSGVMAGVEQYSPAGNDLWALGVLLVNLTCGRNPWKQACGSDETFCAFYKDPDFLRRILPISLDVHHILKGLFHLNPKERTPLPILRRQIMSVQRFDMTDVELSHASKAVRDAAAQTGRFVRPAIYHPPPQQIARPFVPQIDTSVGAVLNAARELEMSWSGDSAYDEDQGSRYAADPSSSTPGSTRSTDIITPVSRPGITLAPNTSRSSSYGNLPPVTPPFFPADHRSLREWDTAPAGKQGEERRPSVGDVAGLEEAFRIAPPRFR